jgi:YVTN family beta-propeller protein
MARVEGLDEDREILAGGGPERVGTEGPRRLGLVCLAVLALGLAAVGGYRVGTQHPPSSGAHVAPTTVLRIPGGRPSGAGFADGSVWVTAWDGHVVRVDPATRRIVAKVPVGPHPLAVKEAFGSVWVTGTENGDVTRIDPVTNQVRDTISVGPVPYQLAAAGGGLWVATQEAAVKIDPETDRVVHRTPYPHQPTTRTPDMAGVGLDANEHGVWVSTAAGTVLRMRPDDGRLVATIRLIPGPSQPGSVVIVDNRVWVSKYATEKTAGPGAGDEVYGRSVGVAAIDTATNRVVQRVASAGYPVSGMLFLGRSLFMLGQDYQTNTSVLVRTEWPYLVLDSVRQVGGGSFDVVAARGSLWIPSWRQRTLRILPLGG